MWPHLGSNKAVGLTPMVRKDPRVCPFRNGFPRTNPVTRGWDVSMINPYSMEGPGFLGIYYKKYIKSERLLYVVHINKYKLWLEGLFDPAELNVCFFFRICLVTTKVVLWNDSMCLVPSHLFKVIFVFGFLPPFGQLFFGVGILELVLDNATKWTQKPSSQWSYKL